MSLADARTAPLRTDLPFLRHRRRSEPPPQATEGTVVELGTAPRPRSTPPAAAPTPTPTPAPTPTPTSLDLSGPSPVPAAPVVSASLDLSAPTRNAPDRATADRATTPAATVRLGPATPAPSAYRPPRTRADAPTLLTQHAPTVTLNRVQSGVGVLRIEAACAPSVGDLRLGCAYQLNSGVTSVVQHASGVKAGPAGTQQPLIIGGRGQYEAITLDLVQVRDLDRLVIYAFSGSDSALRWGGTLVVTTFGQDRIKVALDHPPSTGVVVLLSVFNVAGELVIRSEAEHVPGSLRDACVAFGFDQIAWLDARTPLT